MGALTARAVAAYFRAEGWNPRAGQPGADSGEIERAGKRYVVLRNCNDILAVYRIRNDGMLKRLKRWPAGLGNY